LIFVTVGTSPFDFSRLLKLVDGIADSVIEELLFQTGYTEYIPQNGKSVKFLPKGEFDLLFREATLVISHAGAGSIINSIKYSIPLVLCPRRSSFGEHCDDHQVELADKISHSNPMIFNCEEEECMRFYINKYQGEKKSGINRKFAEKSAGQAMLIEKLKDYLASLKA
jgi:UDP-N-acetylglucosamine transferase subunit ALG13